jgi:hypothetical protein
MIDIGPGLLAEATTSIIKDELTKTLVREGVSERDARIILEENWTEGENSIIIIIITIIEVSYYLYMVG